VIILGGNMENSRRPALPRTTPAAPPAQAAQAAVPPQPPNPPQRRESHPPDSARTDSKAAPAEPDESNALTSHTLSIDGISSIRLTTVSGAIGLKVQSKTHYPFNRMAVPQHRQLPFSDLATRATLRGSF
jgi:hypothetical protein